MHRRGVHHRKRRIRKKWRIGEYTQYGFEVWLDAHSADEAGRALDALVAIAEGRGLYLGGGFNRDEGLVFVTRQDGASCTDADRAAFVDIARIVPGVTNVEAMPLEDVWA